MSNSENILKFPDIASVETEAAEWVVRLEGGACSAEDYTKFQEWLSRSALHREVASRLFGLWSDFDALKAFVPQSNAGSDVENKQRWNVWPATSWRALACAAACLVVLCASGFIYSLPDTIPPTTILYQTAVGNQRTVKLSDGSTAFINTDSKVEVTYSDDRRDVRLLKGEAYFEVAHNDVRPFTVFSGDRMVRDIGTAFDVRLLQNAVEVTVTKGAVELTNSKPSSHEAEPRLGVVTAGQNAVFDRKIMYLKPVSDTNIGRQLAWRKGFLVYAGEPLAQVVADVSRYTNIKIELSAPELRDVPVGGYFAIKNLDAIFVAFEKNFGIRAEWSDSSHVRLVAASLSHARRKMIAPLSVRND